MQKELLMKKRQVKKAVKTEITPPSKIQLTDEQGQVEIELEGTMCGECQNVMYTQHFPFESPSFCCWCGAHFDSEEPCSKERLNELGD